MSHSINQKSSQNFKIAIVAGEKSGDELGGPLICSLKEMFPKADFIGIGGQKMIDAGLKSLFNMDRILE